MPAPTALNVLPGQSTIAQLLPSGKGQDATTADSTGRGQFAAHFAHLIGKQLAVQVENGALPAAASLEAEHVGIETQPEDQLDALLPFIEALGLMQDADEKGTDNQVIKVDSLSSAPDAGIAASALATPPVATSIAAPVAPPASLLPEDPAISAAKPEHTAQYRHGLTSALNMAAQAPMQPTVTKPSELADFTEPTKAMQGLPAEPPASTKELSAGREFSSQLAQAISASKEERAPGSVAAAVHQVIASSSPAQTKSSNSIDHAVDQPVGSVEWSDEISNRIAWMAGRSESRAELVLTPPQMGRIEVNLTIKGDQAAASFASSNPVVREALEAALPRLREVLADAGIQLGQAQVNAENAHQWAQQEKHGDNSGSDPTRDSTVSAAISPISSGSLSTAATLKAGRGLVDVFA